MISFGMAAPTEIAGVVFVDENGSGKYEQGEKTVSGALLLLENGKVAKTDAYGSYTFINPSAGDHTITLKLESLPVQYLPAVPLKKDIVVYEGITYTYDIPLKQESEN